MSAFLHKSDVTAEDLLRESLIEEAEAKTRAFFRTHQRDFVFRDKHGNVPTFGKLRRTEPIENVIEFDPVI